MFHLLGDTLYNNLDVFKMETNLLGPETRSPLQEPDPVRPALRGRGADGVQRLHAAVAQLQAPVARLRGRPAQVFHHTHIPAATASLFRYVAKLVGSFSL